MKASTRRRIDARLEAAYARVPVLACQGHCYTSCGMIECSDRERDRIAQAGVTLPTLAEFRAMDREGVTVVCPALSPTGRCTVYAIRPMLCRLWGAVENMPCVYGCQPVTGGLLAELDGFELLGESLEAGGAPASWGEVSGPILRQAVQAQPEVTARIMARGRAGDLRRAGRIQRAVTPRPTQPEGGAADER